MVSPEEVAEDRVCERLDKMVDNPMEEVANDVDGLPQHEDGCTRMKMHCYPLKEFDVLVLLYSTDC